MTEGGARAGLRRWLAAGPLSAKLGTAGLLLAALCLVLPWYSIDNAIGGAHDPLVEYSLTEKALHLADGTTRIVPLEITPCHCPQVAHVFGLVQILAWTGAVVAAGAYWARTGRARLPPVAGLGLTAVAGVLVAAGPVLLALSAPSAFLADGERVSNVVPIGRWGAGFWGSHVENIAQTTLWGPALGWFAALGAGALTLCAFQRPRGPVSAEAEAAPAVARAPTLHATAPPAAPLPADAFARENAFVPPPS